MIVFGLQESEAIAMTVQDMGAIGDLVGGIAVLVTLVYLAIQIKQNTEVHASLIRQNFYDATQQQILHGVESSVFNDLIHRGWSTSDQLSGGEQTQIWRHMQGVLMGYQGAFEQFKSGALPEKDWALARLILRSFWLLDGKAKNDAWEQMSSGGFFNQDFLEEVESLKEGAQHHRQRLDERGLQL
jgi:hypothetical protein